VSEQGLAAGRRPSFLETGAVAWAPDIALSARGTGPSSGGALVPYRRAGTPAIDDASAIRRTMATRAASVCGMGRADDGEAAGEQSCHDKVFQCFLHGWSAPDRPRWNLPRNDF
jgi:hypothetical protein